MPAIFTFKAPALAIIRDLDPARTNQRTVENVVGPNEYTVEQAFPFEQPWSAYVNDSNEFWMVPPSGPEFQSSIYDGSLLPNHIALAFDAVSRHTIAWEINGQIRLGWEAGGVPTYIDFPGRSPVIFSTWAIDGTITGGESTVCCLYTRPNDGAIYCRAIVESYATERVWSGRTVDAFYLQEVVITERKFMDVVGMDSNHRRVVWRSEEYTPVPLPQANLARMSEEIEGLYWEIPPVAWPEGPVPVTLDTEIGGAFEELRVSYFPDPEQGNVTLGTEIGGEFRELRVTSDPDPQPQAQVRLVDPVFDYYEAAKFQDADSQGQVRLGTEISGSYTAV